MSYHPAKFAGHSQSGTGVRMILVPNVISQDYVKKGLCDFVGGSLCQVW